MHSRQDGRRSSSDFAESGDCCDDGGGWAVSTSDEGVDDYLSPRERENERQKPKQRRRMPSIKSVIIFRLEAKEVLSVNELTVSACFFLANCSADLTSSSVTPCVERLVSRTRFACAFRCVSDSSSRTGGTNDLNETGDTE